MVDTVLSGVVRETLVGPPAPTISPIVSGIVRETLMALVLPQVFASGIARETLYAIPTTRVLNWTFGW